MAVRRTIEIAADGTKLSATEHELLLPADITHDQWMEVGRLLGRSYRSLGWWIGDWINTRKPEEIGFADLTDLYNTAAHITDLKVTTLQNYSSIARRVPPKIRRPDLAFALHEPVAALHPQEQREWLDRAADEGWNKYKLRNELSGHSMVKRPTLRQAAYEVCIGAEPSIDAVYIVPASAMEDLADALKTALRLRVEGAAKPTRTEGDL